MLDYGRDEFLRRLAHPFWFQSFGAVMGMDWHSSGITTSVLGALKRGLAPLCGRARPPRLRRPRRAFAQDAGRARCESASAPASTARRWRGRAGWSPRSTARRCRTASTSTCTASSSPTTASGSVVQQGMNGDDPLCAALPLAVRGPEAASSRRRTPRSRAASEGEIVNLTDAGRRRPRGRGSSTCCATSVPIASSREVAELDRRPAAPEAPLLPHLVMPAHHDVRPKDVMLRRLHGALAAAADRGPADFAELLLVPGVGARTVRSLAMVAEVIHGAPCRFADPARFSLAHGGKDRASVPGPDPGLRPDDRRPEGGGREGAARQRRAARRDPPARRAGATARGAAPARPTSPPTSLPSGALRTDYRGRSVFGWEPRPERAARS